MRLPGFAIAFLFIIATVFSSSCKKESLLTSGGELQFSTDTLNFDTVFTSLGSFTLQLKIFNPQNQKVNISSVRLHNGGNSFFHLNINGISGNNVTDIELAANDSIYVFATVKIDPNNDTIPFIVEDRLIATMNGKEYSLPFYAYGQNAYYLRDSVIQENTTWKTDKPYVILHSAAVDKGHTLNIPAGCRIYMHADSRLYVLGTLNALGTKKDSIIFQGDRLDRGYFGNEGYPGEWGGIYFDSSSTGNKMEWCVLKNCGNNISGGLPFAIEVFGMPGIPLQLTLKNTIIQNSLGYGILSFGGNIKAENCLVNDCGAQALAIFQGGTYEFTNCDFINFFPKKVSHTDEPTVAVLNYFPVSNMQVIAGDLTAVFTNCLIYGSLENELFVNKVDETEYHTTFTNCLVKHNQEEKPTFNLPKHELNFVNCILNEDPQFENYEKQNFRPKSNSPLIDNGASVSLVNDLDNKPRPQGAKFDIGCYEFQP
ncbi:MAG TPA: choice-of-anchor Q domain-containing protein [Flavipsychrobacter sp.]|nr:choice-of-anchor Q domain-containing protein [Flavipsychrobacter sp.]